MFVNPFWFGVLMTIVVEAVVLIAVGIAVGTKKEKTQGAKKEESHEPDKN